MYKPLRSSALMKKLIVFLILALLSSFGYSRSNVLPTPNQVNSGDTMVMCNESICYGSDFNFPIPPFLGFVTSCSYYCNGIRYNNTNPYIFIPATNTVPDTTIICYIDSMNGLAINKVRAIIITINSAPAILIPVDSIHHVTCPNGAFYPYGDGAFSVMLEDSSQNYSWIDVESDSSFFFVHTYYDDFTLTGLRAGTYRVVTHGANGCVCTDSVVIEGPEPWYSNPDSSRKDTVCLGELGCNSISLCGGTPPYHFTWFYFDENSMDTIFLEDTTRLVCGLSSGRIYYVYMYDSRGCKARGEEIEFIITYLYEYVEDTTHIITIDPVACYGHDFIVQAQSIGVGTYTWTIGGVDDTTNYWTSIYGDSMFVADYMTPPLFEPTYVTATFSDQHGCVTHDSVWVDVYNPGLSLSIETEDIITDSTCVIHVSPLGGSLYLDGMLIVENVPDPYILSTAGISVGEHTLKYAGVFGMEQGLYCEEEVEVSFNVQSHPFVTDWNMEISIYPNPATTILNLSSTEMMNFTICITDVAGRVVLREKILDSFYPVDVSSLTSGIYLLRLETPEGATKSIKFVKK